MDVNGLRFWMLANEQHWQCTPETDYDAHCRRLRLRSARGAPLPDNANDEEAETQARLLLKKVPQTRDLYGTRAYWDSDLKIIAATGAVSGAVRIFDPPGTREPEDMVVGHDGVLYITINGNVHMHDLRNRWVDVELSVPFFRAWRLAADPTGGVWVMAKKRETPNGRFQRLAHVHGLPLPSRPYQPSRDRVMRPVEENPKPPTMTVLPQTWPEHEVVGIACSPRGRVAILAWREGHDAELIVQQAGGGVDIRIALEGVRFPYTLTWLSETQIATRIGRLPNEALIYDVGDVLAEADEHVAANGNAPASNEIPSLEPVGQFYPLREAQGGAFVHTLRETPHYPTIDSSAPLHRLSAPSYESEGVARSRTPLDSGSTTTVWHRLYLEASVPPHCAIRVYLAATDTLDPPAREADWHEHQFGEFDAGPDDRILPRGAWVSAPSEVPFHEGLLGDAPVPQRSGLFTALIQRSNRRVRSLRGRYLWVKTLLTGDGRSTPEIAALRAYGSRFSYVERYLPVLYHEQMFSAERDEVLAPQTHPASTPADFLERFVDNCEGLLTVLEDRIAHAYLLTDPRTVPEASLEWLGSWIGMSFDAAYPADRRRELLKAAPHLFRTRGTLSGLRDALGIATGGSFEDGRVVGGAVDGGEIVVLENWRLRRTFATILGADLADEDDPLLGGLAVSGNSHVGDTLFLGDEHRKDFLALFQDGLTTPAEAKAVADFFERQAHRITVLVHQDIEPQDLGLIRRIIDLEKPAHVDALVARARYPFMVGMASLIGVDSYLGPPAKARPVDLNRSLLGSDFLLGPASLDPRLTSSRAPVLAADAVRPIAVLRAPERVLPHEDFALDAAESRAGVERTLDEFHWSWLQ